MVLIALIFIHTFGNRMHRKLNPGRFVHLYHLNISAWNVYMYCAICFYAICNTNRVVVGKCNIFL